MIWQFIFPCPICRERGVGMIQRKLKTHEVLLVPTDGQDPRALVLEFSSEAAANRHRTYLSLCPLPGWELVNPDSDK